MKISFIIPAYNEESYIKLCLESVKKEINRIAADAEIIVVNNASTDNTREIIKSFDGVRIVDESRKGLVWARMAGYLASKGELLANIDADTIMPEGWLTKVLSEFEKNPNLLALSGPYIYYDLPFVHRVTTKFWYIVGFIFDNLNYIFTHKKSMLQGGNFILRREALDKIGGFDTSIKFYGEDIDIGRRISEIGDLKWTFDLPMKTSGRRIRVNGVLKTGFTYAMNFLWITFKKKPFTEDYNDIRISSKPE